MARTVCEVCEYPTKTCICEAIVKVDIPLNIVVIQHPKETKHPKNTVRLLRLLAPAVQIIKSDNKDALAMFREGLDVSNTYVFYPNDGSEAFENYTSEHFKVSSATLIFIDATWRQAYGILQNQEWIKQCKLVHFEHPPSSQYRIRKSKEEYQLSTLEAVSYALGVCTNKEMLPFERALDALQKHWDDHANNAKYAV